MVSLKEVARVAGVNISTVSRALRNHPNVDPATAQRIQEIAREMGYQTNARISTLMSYVRSSKGKKFRETLAFVWPDVVPAIVKDTYQLRRFESGAMERARQLGYGLDVFYHDSKTLSWERMRSVFKARNIRGLILGPVTKSSHAHLNLNLDIFACAAIGEGFVHPRLPHTRFDHFVGMRTALHQLKHDGAARIGFALDYERNLRAAPLLYASFVATRKVRPGLKDELFYQAQILEPKGVLAWAKKAKLEALLLSHDIDELAGLDRLADFPKPLRIATLNRLRDSSPFPGIDQQQDLIASHACDLVVEQLNRNEFGVPEFPKTVLVEGVWRDIKK